MSSHGWCWCHRYRRFVHSCFPASTAQIDDAPHRPVPIAPVPLTSSNFGSPGSYGSDTDGMVTRPGTTSDEKLGTILSKLAHFDVQLAQIPVLSSWMSRMESHVTATFGGIVARLTEMEHNFSALSARMCKIETSAVSASSVSGSARYCPSTGQVDSSTAAGSHDPRSSEENRNARRRLDIFSSPDDENARSAVLTVSLRTMPCRRVRMAA